VDSPTGARPSIDLTGPLKVDALAMAFPDRPPATPVGWKRAVLVSSLCSGRLFHPLNLSG